MTKQAESHSNAEAALAYTRDEIFSAPYREWSSEQILRHYQTRRDVQYFPVIDPLETNRDTIHNILNDHFEFNQESYHASFPLSWLSNPSQDIEWHILLHKFYHAVGLGIAYHDTKDDRYVQKWIELTESWIDTVPLEFLSSDVTGRRIQNWIFAHYYFVTLNDIPCLPHTFYRKFLQSLHAQVSYVLTHLTSARNHRTLELCAIFLAGVVFPEFTHANEWLTFSKQELLNNIQTDLLPDGVHCELSTDYHHLVLKNYLWVRRLAFLNQIAIAETMDILIKKSLEFSLFSHKPDGWIPSINDGDSRCFLDLLEQGYEIYGNPSYQYVLSKGLKGIPPAERSKGFSESGYYILRSGWGDGTEPYEDERYLFFDCGPLGAGSHGHFDVLSFEMAAFGRSLVVDPGRYTYSHSGAIDWRAVFRGTSYHNTVLVDGKNQTSYLLKKKRKRKGPPPHHALKTFVSEPGFDYLHGIAQSHEYPVIHERKIFFVCPDYWIVSDLLLAEESHDYDLLFHLSDEADGKVTTTVSDRTLCVDAPHLILAQSFDPGVSPSVEHGYVSRTYGVKHAAPIVQFTRHAATACYHTIVFPYKENRPNLVVDSLPVLCHGHSCLDTHASALCITIERNGERFQDYYCMNHALSNGDYTFGQFTHQDTVCFVRTGSDGTVLMQYVV